ncbi:MAG: hypothetical protein M3Z64_04785 [Verrucomicrobiota bacterium]|nr:hypothetical protein [Verrucomicrobiota bacterium]
MPDDETLKALLERLCTLQEQQLAKLSEIVERSTAAREKLEEMSQRWLSTFEDSQKKMRARAAGQVFGAWVRTGLTVFMLGLIALAVIIAHYLK